MDFRTIIIAAAAAVMTISGPVCLAQETNKTANQSAEDTAEETTETTVRKTAGEMVKELSDAGLEKIVSYDVSAFTDIRDKKLQDVLVKMPGLSVNTYFGTSFYFNGMMVTKVLVNGIDMLGGDYSSILSMKPEDVSSIEITENYVHIKVLRGISFSNYACINIILTEEARSKWSGSVKGGLGASPLLYNAEAQALNIGTNAQTTVLLKADNTGLDFSSDLTTQGMMGYKAQQMISLYPSLAPLSEQRTRINNSAFGNVNTTFQLKNDLQLSLQFSLHSDKLTASSLDETTYFTGQGQDITLTTGENNVQKQKDFLSSITLLSNSEKGYLYNNLCVLLSRTDASNGITGSYPSSQSASNKPFELQNMFQYYLPLGKNVLNIGFRAGYEKMPQNLSVSRSLFNLNQDILSESIYGDLSASYKLALGKFSLAFSAATSAESLGLNTLLSPEVSEVGANDNNSKLSYINGNVSVDATYVSNKFQFQLSLPLDYYHYRFDDFRLNDIKKTDKFEFSPSLSAKYQPTNNLSFSVSAYSMDLGVSNGDIYSGMVLSNFNTFSKGFVNFGSDKYSNASVTVSYRNPVSSFFINGSAMRTWNKQANSYSSSFTPNFMITGYEEDPFHRVNISDYISADISKGINSFKGKIGLNTSLSISRSSLNRNNILLPFITKTYSVGADVNGKVFSWFNVIYAVNFSYSTLSVQDDGQSDIASNSKGLTENLEFIFSPWKKFNFSFLADHYLNKLSEDEYKNLVLLDFKAEYKINERWQLIASITNLLNQNVYDYKLISSITATSSYTSYTIRPRNLLLSVFFKF